MDPIPPETRSIQSLLTSLIIVTILILGLVLVIAAYPTVIKPILAPATPPIPSLRPSGTLTPNPTVTLTPTLTHTPRPTHTSTITPTPTGTLVPSLTPTPPGPPTLTPAQPVPGDPYKLGDWSPDLANLAIELMNDFPNTLITRLRGEDNRGYYDAFYYATLAGKEGLLRFHDSPFASQWHFDLAYNLAQTSNPEAGQVYADILTQLLNQGKVELSGLAEMFVGMEPRMRLNLIELNPPSGYLSSHIVEVHGPGSAFIWLLETPSGYQYHVLDSNFDFVNAPEMRLIVSDLTGDGIEEAAIYNSAPAGVTLEAPRIFDLSNVPANELFFRPSDEVFDPSMEYTNNWRPVKNEKGSSNLQLELQLFPACPTTVQQTYQWNGAYLEHIAAQFEVEPAASTLSLCRHIVEHAANLWGPQAAIQIMEQLLPDWPPAVNEEGKPFPADAKDEWRYRLGIYHALVGNFDQANAYLNELVQTPIVSDGAWVQSAQQFLAIYKAPQDIYKACVQSQSCNPNNAIDFLINIMGVPEGQDPVEFLKANGLTLRSSGYFDFDGDDIKERWFTTRHRPLEKLDLWFVAATKNGQRALHVGPVEGDKPNLQFLNTEDKPPIVWIDEGIFAVFGRDSDIGQPYLRRVTPAQEYPNRFKLALEQARRALLNGEDANKVLKMLTDIQSYPGLLCKPTFTCDEYYYLLGLANELLGNERPAVEAYLTLWRDYSRSPFTTLARLKLARTNEPATPTPTSTLTPAPTSLTPQVTPTPTFTLVPGTTARPPTATPTVVSTGVPTATEPGYYPPPTATFPPYP